MQKLVIATGNAHKLHEIKVLLEPLGIEVIPQSDFNVPEAAEPHCTFIENALAKARHAARLTGLPALADDSGVCANAVADDSMTSEVRTERCMVRIGRSPIVS